jgi:hypothetical protein
MGAFHPASQPQSIDSSPQSDPSLGESEADALALCHGGLRVRTVLIVGSAGPELWKHFSAWLEGQAVALSHPLDAWTRMTVDGLVEGTEFSALYPFDGPPHWPFQRWAARAAPAWSSPLGIFIHQDYGLWFGLRAALLSSERWDVKPQADAASPCQTCVERPCLQGCPVSAFRETEDPSSRFDASACRSYLDTHPQGACMREGCRARRGCPIGAAYRYDSAQMQFHMLAFRAALPR